MRSIAELKQALAPGDVMLFTGALLPDQHLAPPPKLKAITRAGSPILCDEGYASYLATVQTGETGVALLLHGMDVAGGSRGTRGGYRRGMGDRAGRHVRRAEPCCG